jgi:hypothetical protein
MVFSGPRLAVVAALVNRDHHLGHAREQLIAGQ